MNQNWICDFSSTVFSFVSLFSFTFTRTRFRHVERFDLGSYLARLIVDDGLVMLRNIGHCGGQRRMVEAMNSQRCPALQWKWSKGL